MPDKASGCLELFSDHGNKCLHTLEHALWSVKVLHPAKATYLAIHPEECHEQKSVIEFEKSESTGRCIKLLLVRMSLINCYQLHHIGGKF